MLTALTLFSFLLATLSLGLLGVLCIDRFLDLSLPSKDFVVGVDLSLESRDIRVQVLVRLLEVLGVLPVQGRCVEVGCFVGRIRGDDLVVELARTVVVLRSAKGDSEAQLAGDVAWLSGGHSRERLEAERVVARVDREIAEVQVGGNVGRIELHRRFELSDGGLLVAHDQVGDADVVVYT